MAERDRHYLFLWRQNGGARCLRSHWRIVEETPFAPLGADLPVEAIMHRWFFERRLRLLGKDGRGAAMCEFWSGCSGESLSWRSSCEASMRPVLVVPGQPSREICGPAGGRGEQDGIGPFPKHGLNEAPLPCRSSSGCRGGCGCAGWRASSTLCGRAWRCIPSHCRSSLFAH